MRIYDGTKFAEAFSGTDKVTIFDLEAADVAEAAAMLTSQTFTTRDGTVLYYKDWGHGPAVVFSHGYPLSSDFWEDQMLFLSQRGYRVIAYDRRGFGRSSQPSRGYDMDTFADDLAELVKALDLRNATFVGHSMDGVTALTSATLATRRWPWRAM